MKIIQRLKNLWKLGELQTMMPKESPEVGDVITILKKPADFAYKYEGKPEAKIIKRKNLSLEDEVAKILKDEDKTVK